jgi:hypothetical protein
MCEQTAKEFYQAIDDTVLDMLQNDPVIGLQSPFSGAPQKVRYVQVVNI